MKDLTVTPSSVRHELSHGLSIVELEERLEMVTAGAEEYDEAEIARCRDRCQFPWPF